MSSLILPNPLPSSGEIWVLLRIRSTPRKFPEVDTNGFRPLLGQHVRISDNEHSKVLLKVKVSQMFRSDKLKRNLLEGRPYYKYITEK